MSHVMPADLEAGATELPSDATNGTAGSGSFIRGVLAAMDVMRLATIIVQSNRRVVALNGRGRRHVIAAGAALIDASGTLRLRTARETDGLQRLIDSAASDGNRRRLMTFRLDDLSTQNTIECLPVDGTGASALVFRMRARVEPPDAADVQALGLTPTEAQVALGLVAGETAEEQAARRGVRAETIRWHVKNIYQRLSCDNRASLSALVLKLL